MNTNQINTYKKIINALEWKIRSINDGRIIADEGYVSLLIQELRNIKIDYLYELSKGA